VVVGPLASALGIPITLVILGLLLPVVSVAALPHFGRLDGRLVIPIEQIRVLRRLPLFAPLPGPTLESIARHLHPVPVPSGEVVVRQGDPGTDFYVIFRGEASVEVDGEPRPPLGPGDHFGEIALLHDIPRTATVRAVTDLELFALDREVFLAALRNDPVALLAAARISAERSGRSRPAAVTGRRGERDPPGGRRDPDRGRHDDGSRTPDRPLLGGPVHQVGHRRGAVRP
jgi:hypothetical protein